MEIPEHYFPVRVCPHIGEDERHRFMFADCGSYENVNLKVNDTDESITFLPQRGQESVKNLARNIPSIPLFTAPLKDDDWKEWDHILGMENYNEVHNGVKYLATMLGHKRAAIKMQLWQMSRRDFVVGVKSLKTFITKKAVI
uniref:Uncharacterized protein n=1 Tax=Arion vulgaris TaxID=1028688 RepID=A0A0B7AIB2_9EUPU